jgi:hypothetical protein
MTFSDISSLASSIAVFVTLVFLVIQTRQTNRNQRALMQQGRSARSVELLAKMADPYLSDLIVRSERGDLTLKTSEVNSLIRTYGAWVLNYEDSFLQYQAGTLDSASWDSDVVTLKYLASEANFRAAWRVLKDIAGSPAFRSYVDVLMRETKLVPLPDFGEQWKIWMTEERAAI